MQILFHTDPSGGIDSVGSVKMTRMFVLFVFKQLLTIVLPVLHKMMYSSQI